MLDEVRQTVFLFRGDDEDRGGSEVVLIPFPVAVREDHDAVVMLVVLLEPFADACRISTATTRSFDLLDVLGELLRLDHLSVPECQIDLGLLVEVVEDSAALFDVGLAHGSTGVDSEEHAGLAVGAVARKIFVALVDAETCRDALAAADGAAKASDDRDDVDLALVLEHDLFDLFTAELAPSGDLALILDDISDHLVYDIVLPPFFRVFFARVVPVVEVFFASTLTTARLSFIAFSRVFTRSLRVRFSIAI